MSGKRVSECVICGQQGCMEFDDKFYCFRTGKTYKKSKGIRAKSKETGSFEKSLRETFSKVSFNKRQTQYQETLFDLTPKQGHIDAIGL